MELQEIHKEILALCVDDYTELWLVIHRMSKDAYPRDSMPTWVRQKTLEVIDDLLHCGLISIGDFWGKPKFKPMSVTVTEAIDYIERIWDDLGHTPTIGDGCWFKATSDGEQLVHELGISEQASYLDITPETLVFSAFSASKTPGIPE